MNNLLLLARYEFPSFCVCFITGIQEGQTLIVHITCCNRITYHFDFLFDPVHDSTGFPNLLVGTLNRYEQNEAQKKPGR